MNDGINTNRLYDYLDLAKLTFLEFQGFDSRVRGEFVVIINATTSQPVSVPLNDFEVETLLLRLNTAFPDTRCDTHRPWTRGRRPFLSFDRPCTCTKVFASRLLACRVEALDNAGAQIVGGLTAALDEARAM